MDLLDGRVAVVTGAASGIGRALAERFAVEGMRVVAADVEADALADTEAALREGGGTVVPVVTDVSDPAAVDALADTAYDRFGVVHLVCNNAGVFQGGITWQRTLADWQWVMGVNFWGMLHGIRAFVPRMLAQVADGRLDEGHVVNTASLAGLLTVGYSAPYTVSKFAAVALTESLAHDLDALGAPIGVSCLVPGLVDTRIADSTRNRPDEPPGETQAPDSYFVQQALRNATSTGGRPPDDVAGLVVDAVRAGRFWIPTSDSYATLLQARFDAMLALEAARASEIS
jgi:NAD(P)-dependent dehydrogenase (short-subunit alcohol dehydrogenase family)